MGWIEQTRRAADVLAARRPSPQHGSVSFASQRIDLTMKVDRKTFGKPSDLQAQAWAAYETIGEIGYVVDFFSNCARRVSLYPAVQGDEGLIAADDEEAHMPTSLVEQARVELERVTGTEGGIGEVLAQMAIMFKVPGEGWLLAREDPEVGEVWQVVARDALTARDGGVWVKATPNDRGTRLDPDTSFLSRFWRASSRWPGLPFSELMRILGQAESLQLIGKAMNSASMSRIAGAGMLFVDKEADIASSSDIPDETWLDDFIRAASTPIRDPGSVASFVPYVAEVNSNGGERKVEDLVHYQTFARELTSIEVEREAMLIKRMSYGLDAPPELVTGFADVNHWTGWLVSDQTYQGHVEPLMTRIADVLAVQVMRRGLRAANRWSPDLIDRLVVGVNSDELVARPDPTQDAKDAHAALVISDSVLRNRLDFDDDDAPSNDELLRRMALKRGITTADITRELLQVYADAELSDKIYNDRGEVIGTTADTDPADAPSENTQPIPDTDPTEAAAIVAAASLDAALGELLTTIDERLSIRLQAAADAAIRRGMERATNRARTLARRTPHQATVNDVDPMRLASVRPSLDALAIDPDDLVRDADLAQLEAQWNDWTEEAMVAALLALYARGLVTADALAIHGIDVPDRATVPDPAGVRNVDDAVDEWTVGRAAGWAILAAAVLGRLRTIVDVGPDEQPPEQGEYDPSMLIQTGPIREALSVAGGAEGSVAQGGAILVDAGTAPAGEYATGQISVRLVNAAGGVLAGFQWLTGAPRFPFGPHQDLSGVVFSGWGDPAVANTSSEWPGYPQWFPGDHPGCRCSAAPRFDLPPAVDSTPDTED